MNQAQTPTRDAAAPDRSNPNPARSWMTPARSRTGSLPLTMLAATVVAALILPECTNPIPKYDPAITGADFVAGVDNPWFPLAPGSTWTYAEGEGPDQLTVVVLCNSDGANPRRLAELVADVYLGAGAPGPDKTR